MSKRLNNPVLPGGLLSPLTTSGNLTTAEITLVEHLQAGDGLGEVPSGIVNGINKTFTLLRSPSPADSLTFYIDGQLKKAGGEDYTLSGNIITLVDGSLAPDKSKLLVFYFIDTDT